MAPRILLHDNPAQPASCLTSLVEYAHRIERTELARTYTSLDAIVGWLRLQPVKLDTGEAPQLAGCGPSQRSRIWPLDGMNCWEATAHFLGVAIALEIPEVVHVFDVTLGTTRHVFPALQDALQQRAPVPVELQPALVKDLRAQAWWNDVADVAHQAGSGVLTAFGGGALVPYVEKAWQQAPREYGLTKYKDAPPAPPVDVKAAATEALPGLTQRLASVPLEADEKRLLNNPTVQSLLAKLEAAQKTPQKENQS